MNTPKKHKHYDAIVAWAEGKTVQFKAPHNGNWVDAAQSSSPSWLESYDYRVKPETVKWRAYLYRAYSDQLVVYTVTLDLHNVDAVEKLPGFVCWLGDWQETEV